MKIDAKTLGAIIGSALLAASGGSFATHRAESAGASSACEGVVKQFLSQLSAQQAACDERVKACWEHNRPQ